ncbi:MAG: GHKL domain-containing protein [Muribaculaceae bacterium]|nr:GHKL domain-containing protein [Alistipes senegalensis]MCM1473702.1 GHKL domain-containing protein [Muribaculaceae bacterium]
MDMSRFLSALIQMLILLPGAASCYLTIQNRMRYSKLKTFAMCMAVILPFSVISAVLHTMLSVDLNAVLLPSLVMFFFLFRRTINLNFSCTLAIYMGVCAIETFPAQFAYAFDAIIHPESGAFNLSTEASLFQFGLSVLMLSAFTYPATHNFQLVVDRLNFPKLWYSTVALSAVFLILNVIAVPQSYSTLHTGRMIWIFPIFEAGAFAVLTSIYTLFYHGAFVILEHTKLSEHTRLLEMQARQYHSLQEHMRQTARLRHDFRHSVRLLSSLAEKGDIDSIRTHLAEYDISLTENAPANYCANAALNALFGYYQEMANSAGIHTDWQIELPEPLSFAEPDMAALFGNIMENAIAGCQTLRSDSRYFCLTTEIRNGNRLYIVSTNNFDGVVKMKDGQYLSTKRNGSCIGMESMKIIAEKYHGIAKFSHSRNEFYTDIALCLPKDNQR